MDIAVIPTYNRPAICRESIEAIYPQVDMVLVLDNGDKEFMPPDTENAYAHWYVQPFDEHPGNLSKAWNTGIAWAKEEAGEDPLYVAVLNDDCVVAENWFKYTYNNMLNSHAIAGCTGPHDVVLRRPGIVPVSMRMTGWAFLLDAQMAPPVDEQFQWWCGDTDLDWQCRQLGGMAMGRGPVALNRFADQSTHGIRAEQAVEDVGRFVDKWGTRPY
jgi:glycosyltransferase involved in cell wall biosynthesis